MEEVPKEKAVDFMEAASIEGDDSSIRGGTSVLGLVREAAEWYVLVISKMSKKNGIDPLRR